MDHRVEPPSWLPERAAPAVTDEVTANGSAPAPGAAGHGLLNGTDGSGTDTAATDHGEGAPDGAGLPDMAAQDTAAHEPFTAGVDHPPGDPVPGQEPVKGEAHSLTYGQAGSYVDEYASPYTYPPDSGYQPEAYGQENPYSGGFAAESGYNHGVMSETAGGDTSVPPYPAEMSAQSTDAATGRSTFATAAYRALPKPKSKARNRAVAATPARRANLVVARLEPWSVMKFSFLMSLVAWVVLFVAVALLYYALSGLGVFDAIQRTLSSVTSSQTSAGVDLSRWTSAPRVLGYTMLIGAVNIVLITALSTLGAMIYNLVTHLGGGIEVTLRETD